jgi:hypothetical protein
MNRHERRAAAAKAAREAGHVQQECACGWLAPRECYTLILSAEPAPAQIRMVVICPVCGRRFERDVTKSAEA